MSVDYDYSNTMNTQTHTHADREQSAAARKDAHSYQGEREVRADKNSTEVGRTNQKAAPYTFLV